MDYWRFVDDGKSPIDVCDSDTFAQPVENVRRGNVAITGELLRDAFLKMPKRTPVRRCGNQLVPTAARRIDGRDGANFGGVRVACLWEIRELLLNGRQRTESMTHLPEAHKRERENRDCSTHDEWEVCSGWHDECANQTHGAGRFSLNQPQRGKKYRHQYRNDRNDDKQFNERKTFLSASESLIHFLPIPKR